LLGIALATPLATRDFAVSFRQIVATGSAVGSFSHDILGWVSPAVLALSDVGVVTGSFVLATSPPGGVTDGDREEVLVGTSTRRHRSSAPEIALGSRAGVVVTSGRLARILGLFGGVGDLGASLDWLCGT